MRKNKNYDIRNALEVCEDTEGGYLAPYEFERTLIEALEEENYKKADSLNAFIQGQFTQSYAPLGTMYINFMSHYSYTNYYRELDISNSIAKTSYEVDDVKFQREYFVSHPNQIMAVKLTSSKKKSINCSINFESLLKFKIESKKNILEVSGYAPVHAEPSYRGDMPNAVIFDENKGTRFTTLFKIKNTVVTIKEMIINV